MKHALLALPLALPLLALAPPPAQTSPTAATAAVDAEFRQSDANHDGYLSRAELAARMARLRVQGRPVDAVHAKRLTDLFLTRADADKDGRISAAESRRLMGNIFSAYDVNHDGRIDPKEAAAARAAANAAVTKPR